jgi:hypothetical protein
MACSPVVKTTVFVLLAVCGLAPFGHARADQARPNILFILTDPACHDDRAATEPDRDRQKAQPSQAVTFRNPCR